MFLGLSTYGILKEFISSNLVSFQNQSHVLYFSSKHITFHFFPYSILAMLKIEDFRKNTGYKDKKNIQSS